MFFSIIIWDLFDLGILTAVKGICFWQMCTCSKEFPVEERVREEDRNKAWAGCRMAAGDSRATSAVREQSEKEGNRGSVWDESSPTPWSALWDEGGTPKFSEVSCSQLYLQCCGFESWEVDALSHVHLTQSICGPTPAPTEQCDLHLASAQCEQTDQPLGDKAKAVS